MARRAIIGICLALQTLATAAGAQGDADGLDTTRAEAAAGSADAQFRLGTIYDLGIDGPRDPGRALRWYLSAADAGLPEAQFNLAIMLDAGIDVAREPAAAALWYARAAAAGHARAQYNLALLYATGEGVPHNAELAGAWFDLAAETLPAARRREAPFAPASAAGLSVPETPSMHQTSRGATFVWTARESGKGTRFRVEVLSSSQDVGDSNISELASHDTYLSSYQLPVQSGSKIRAWRVVHIDRAGGREAASEWERPGPQTKVTQTLVKLKPRTGDDVAGRTAAVLSAALQKKGHLVMIMPGVIPEGSSRIEIPRGSEEGLARAVAAFLPGFGSVPIRLSGEGEPGVDMTVSIVGGGAEP